MKSIVDQRRCVGETLLDEGDQHRDLLFAHVLGEVVIGVGAAIEPASQLFRRQCCRIGDAGETGGV